MRIILKFVIQGTKRRFPLIDKEELESFLIEELFQAMKKFDPNHGSKFSSYAITILQRASSRWAKKETSRIKREVLWEDSWEDSTYPILVDFHQGEKLKVQLDFALSQIGTEKQRRIIESFLKNPSAPYKNIEEELGISLSYVKEVIRKYKKILGKFLI